ncbi:sensor histidine kinase [Winogradskyella sp. J14-2]|uniref:sensor histidine kinase n=1 Tax=Winogradskyella sp. J14-2 TaxID=1936080 RepID=UPI000972AEC2|nr:histidine kinase [Winogradskyella sp. J14-2]APY09330.1 sensor histidine kinase [Winogradskyella sp. J14-2]
MKIKARHIAIIALFYLFFSVLYRIVLWYSGNNYPEEGFWGWANPKGYWNMSGMQYLFYFFASLLIWFLGVYLLRHKPKLVQILAVVIMIPIVVYGVREGRYWFIDITGKTRYLRGPGVVWDWYIPSLFMMIQFGCLFTYRYFKENQQKLRVEGELKTAALKSELSALKAQLNPHFLYNIFNTISASVPPENEKTRRMIAELSDLFRYQLKASKVEKVPLGEELEFVNKYLDLEKERFQERLKVDVNVEEHLKEEMVPPMLLQPLVENSIKHGLSSLIEGGEIHISIFKKDDKLHFEIADTGIGIEDKKAVFEKGIGLTNTKLRLEKMYQSTLKLTDNEPKGLKVEFAI